MRPASPCTIGTVSAADGAAARSSASCRADARHTTAPDVSSRDGGRGSVEGLDQSTLDVARFGNRENLGVIERLSAKLAKGQSASGIGRSALQHLEEQRLRKMEA